MAPVTSRLGSLLRVGAMMGRSGLLRPGPPVRVLRQLAALRRWGTLLGGSFVSAAARDPDRSAIVAGQATFTFAEIDTRTNALATALETIRRPDPATAQETDAASSRQPEQGTNPGTGGGPPKVAVLCRNHRWMVEWLIACSKLGADTIMLNTGMSVPQLLAVLAEHQADVLVADPEFAELLDSAPIRTITTGDAPGLARASQARTPPARPGRTIVLSSGTTGRPKGAGRPAKPGLTPVASMLSRIPLRLHDTTVIEAPLFHTWGYASLQLAIALRHTIVLNGRFDPEETLRSIARNRADVLIAVPVMLQRIMELPEAARRAHDTSSLRVVAVSGSSLPGDLATAFMDEFGDVLYNLYGSTESSWVTIATPRDLRESPGTAGTAPPGTRVAILDETRRPMPPGAIGRIFAANELPFEGYTGGAVAETHDGMIGLGDLGRLDAAGRLFVHGRADDMIISGGENVFPGELEDVLARLPGVREVAVVGVPDADFGQRLAAHVVPEPGARLTEQDVLAHARANVSRFAVPREVHFTADLPRNATGKIVRRHLIPNPTD